MTTKVTIYHAHACCGLGGGAQGFNEGEARVEKKLAAGVLLYPHELHACTGLFNRVEDGLTKLSRSEVLDAAQAEQIAIALELNGVIQEAA